MSRNLVNHRQVEPAPPLARRWVAALAAASHRVGWDPDRQVGQLWADAIQKSSPPPTASLSP